FMFGPSILVNPVLKEGSTHRSVYLPESKRWYDFWTGTSLESSREVEAQAPIDRIPLFVRAGSLIPLGPEVEYADEKPEGPIELRVYRGADGSFNLNRDTGNTYAYEKGERAIIPLRWSEASKTLTIGERQGEYPGVPKDMEFDIVWVRTGHGTGETVQTTPDAVVHYSGKQISIRAGSERQAAPGFPNVQSALSAAWYRRWERTGCAVPSFSFGNR